MTFCAMLPGIIRIQAAEYRKKCRSDIVAVDSLHEATEVCHVCSFRMLVEQPLNIGLALRIMHQLVFL